MSESSQAPLIRFLHYLDQPANHKLFQCIKRLPRVIILKREHSQKLSFYHPLEQITTWHALFSVEERENMKTTYFNPEETMRLMIDRALETGRILIIAEPSPLNSYAIPTSIGRELRNFSEDPIKDYYPSTEAALVRHPLSHWAQLSRPRLFQKQQPLSISDFLLHYRQFSEQALEQGFIRVEELSIYPEALLKYLTEQLEIPFTATDLANLNLDKKPKNPLIANPDLIKSVLSLPHSQVTTKALQQFLQNPNYEKCLSILGYLGPNAVV